MIAATDLKKDVTFLLDGKPYKVAKYSHQKIGRGGATVKVALRNLETGNVDEKTFKSTQKLEEINTSKKKLQYLYSDNHSVSLMDPVSYEQVEIPTDTLKKELLYIKEGESLNVLFWEGNALSVEIPPKVPLKVIESAPGVKGNSADNAFKQAKLENGQSLKVPLFIKKGEVIVVDTKTGEYVERSKT